MTAPLDIGLEQQDMSLVGQDDMFDLRGAQQERDGSAELIGSDGDPLGDEEIDQLSDEASDLNEENESKVHKLEAELDGLYNAYQDRLRERDAKFKVMEARRNNTEREEWSGIQTKTFSDRENDSDEAGSWDKMQHAKELPGDSSDEDSSDDEHDEVQRQDSIGRKRSYIPSHDRDSSTLQNFKRTRFIAQSKDSKQSVPSSKAAQIWFSQEVFAGVDGIDKVDEDDMTIDEPTREVQWQDVVSHYPIT